MKVPTPATFSSIESLTIAPKCLQCHQSLSSYDGVMQVVSAGSPSQSRLYQEVSSGDMPKQSTQLSDAEISAINTWIQSGAPND
jgi:mono/diheme cytochrome c family protein